MKVISLFRRLGFGAAREAAAPAAAVEPPPLVLAGDLQESLEAQRIAAAGDTTAAACPHAFQLRQPVTWRGRSAWVQGRSFDLERNQELYDLFTERREIVAAVPARDLRPRDGLPWGERAAAAAGEARAA